MQPVAQGRTRQWNDPGFRALFDHSLDILLITALDGGIEAANPAACTAFGLGEAEIVAAGRDRLIDVQDPRLPGLLAEREATGAARGELTFRRADGDCFQGEISARVFEPAPGQQRTLLTIRDISQRGREQALLDASEAQFRALFSHLPSGVVVHGADGQVIDANPRACEILGLSLDQLLGKAVVDPYWQLLKGDGSPMGVAEFPVSQVAAVDAAVSHIVLGIQRPDRAQPTWGICNAYPVHDAHGVRIQTVVSFVEITERIEAESRLRASEERLRLMLRGSNDAPWDLDLVTDNIYYADRWWEMLGYRPGAMPSDRQLWRRLLHPDDAPRVEALLAEHLRDGPDDFEVEFRLQGATGRFVPLLSRGFILRNEAGVAIRISGVNTDLTERVQAEESRLALEAQLRESQKMESIGTLAGGIAHDFNNILAAILANAALARRNLSHTDDVDHAIRDIEASAQRARQLVQRILAFSRRAPQQLTVRPLGPVVESALSMLAATLPPMARVQARLTDEPLMVLGDETQLQQVVLNLCTNAWHALHGSTGCITVGLERWDPDNAASDGLPPDRPDVACAHLWVRDDGIGMDAATLARIFEPFFTTKPIGQGTGLGLSVVHGIVSDHRGTISAQSQPGRGSLFQVFIPSVDAQPDPTPAEPAAPAWGSGQGQLVMYVDDDEVLMQVVERLLLQMGYRSVCYSNGDDALAAIASGSQVPDVVVTDHNMPGMTGLMLSRRLQALAPQLPVIIGSGYVSDELREQAARAGAPQVLEKQNLLDKLGPMLAAALAGDGPRAGAS